MSLPKGGIIMKRAIIYVRGHNQEKQEMFCRVYAADKGYKVLYVATDLKDVNNCDTLLVANHSRISRDKFKYYEILKELKAKGIEVESVSNQDKVDEYIWLMGELMKR
jgi:DNA invertase Pin-like site-specific DNA recombinase